MAIYRKKNHYRVLDSNVTNESKGKVGQTLVIYQDMENGRLFTMDRSEFEQAFEEVPDEKTVHQQQQRPDDIFGV